jgi:hypothetical protein
MSSAITLDKGRELPDGSGAAGANSRTPENWSLERDRLLQEINELRAERDIYLASLYALTYEEIAFDKEAILGKLNKGQSLQELIEELEASAGSE